MRVPTLRSSPASLEFHLNISFRGPRRLWVDWTPDPLHRHRAFGSPRHEGPRDDAACPQLVILRLSVRWCAAMATSTPRTCGGANPKSVVIAYAGYENVRLLQHRQLHRFIPSINNTRPSIRIRTSCGLRMTWSPKTPRGCVSIAASTHSFV